MANLQKVIKLTQEQYDILASGGTVGDYTGLDPNYIYLVEDDKEYVPLLTDITGLTLSYLWRNNLTDFRIKYGAETWIVNIFQHGTGMSAKTGCRVNNRLGYYDYLPPIGGSTTLLSDILDGDVVPFKNYIITDDLNNYYVKNVSIIPTDDGTLDIGSSSYKFNDVYANGTVYMKSLQGSANSNFVMGLTSGYAFVPSYDNSLSLGTGLNRWRNLYLTGNLTDGTNSITVAQVVAKQDAIEIKRFI